MLQLSRLNLLSGSFVAAAAIVLTFPSAFAQDGGASTSDSGRYVSPAERFGENANKMFPDYSTPTNDPAVRGNRGYKPFQKNPGNDAADRNQKENSEKITGKSGEKRGEGLVGKAADTAKKAINGARQFIPGVDTLDESGAPPPTRLPNGAFDLSGRHDLLKPNVDDRGPITDSVTFKYGLHTITWQYARGSNMPGDYRQCPFVHRFTCRVQRDFAPSKPFMRMRGLYTRNPDGSAYLSELQYSYDAQGENFEADSRGRQHFEMLEQRRY